MALLLIDVINDLDFPEADQMVDEAVKMAHNLAQLKKRAKKAGVPVILRERQLRAMEIGFSGDD